MPNRNGTGPYGEGPATGGRFGRCASRGQRRGQGGQGGGGRGFGSARLNSSENISRSEHSNIKDSVTQPEDTVKTPEIIQAAVGVEQVQIKEPVKNIQQDLADENDQAEKPGQSN